MTWIDLKETKTVLEDRTLSYCNNLEKYEEFIRKERGIDKNKKLKRKIGCDSGGEHFKVTMNLCDVEVKPSSPTNAKKQKKRHKDTSVKATFLIAVVEQIPETRANVKIILDKLNLHSEKFSFTLNSDLKLINIIVGIQGHQSTCPCPFCDWKKADGVMGGGQDRTLGGLR